jgi:carbohydrate kinase (thermoresistant glucokinase family)
MNSADRDPVVLVMGVSGSGKSTVGAALARHTGWPFQDGDALHPPENVAKMRGGTGLTDADRWPWLRRVAGWIAARRAEGGGGVVACSALRRSYRDVLRTGDPQLRLVYLQGDSDELYQRVASRTGHFFPAALLRTQLDNLEEPGPDEHAIIVPIGQSVALTVATVVQRLGLVPPR